MELPALGTITAFSFADDTGSVKLDDGTELRLEIAAMNGMLPAAGLRVRVLSLSADGTAAESVELHDDVQELATKQQYARSKRASEEPARNWGPIMREAGVSRKTTMRILGLGRPSAGIQLGVKAGGVHASRIGGPPAVPRDFAWPTYRDEKLAFVAQVRLGEIPDPVRANLELPDDGLLLFFYAAEAQPWGYDAEHRGGARVYFFDDVDALAPASTLPATKIVPSAIYFLDELSLPSHDTPTAARVGIPASDQDAYSDALGADLDARGMFAAKVGGYPDEIRAAMEPECANIAGGNATEWRLLFQLDTDEDRGLGWGDSGRLYFWIREADLRARAFENAWCMLQCI